MNTEVRARPAVPSTTTAARCGYSMYAVNISSLEMNPNSRGMPAIDAAASTAMTRSTGIRTSMTARRRMSRVPAWWSTTPTTMNREDLNSAWAAVCTVAAVSASGVPTPTIATSRPSWEIVEYASSSLRS